MSQPLDEDTTKGLLIWIDGIELSRPKKNINRDFADGVLVAELIAHFFPHRVEKHNYQAASSRQGKLTNWATLNRKVLAKFGFTVPADVVESIIAAKPNVVEVFLNGLKQIIDRELNAELEQYYEPHQYMEPTPKTKPKKHQMPKARPAQAPKEDLMSTIQAGIPLKNLNLRGIDTDTRLVLAEKEQSLLASHETIKILQMKVHRLEQLLQLKDRRIEELKKQLD